MDGEVPSGAESAFRPEVYWDALTSRSLGRSARFSAVTASTNDDARESGRKGAPHGHLIAADSQTAGRGRMGRSWQVPSGVNLSFSVLLRPAIPLSDVPSLTLCAAVGSALAISDITGVRCGIKWPNDLVFGGRKLCGILSEMALRPNRPGESAALDFAVVGIGLNVNADTSRFPPPLNETAISLREICGAPVSREVLLARLMLRLEEAFDAGFPAVSERYRELSVTLGTHVRVTMPAETLEGLASDLTPSGALILRTDSGEVREILAGDVERLRPR